MYGGALCRPFPFFLPLCFFADGECAVREAVQAVHLHTARASVRARAGLLRRRDPPSMRAWGVRGWCVVGFSKVRPPRGRSTPLQPQVCVAAGWRPRVRLGGSAVGCACRQRGGVAHGQPPCAAIGASRRRRRDTGRHSSPRARLSAGALLARTRTRHSDGCLPLFATGALRDGWPGAGTGGARSTVHGLPRGVTVSA